jgi:hypothetical protein
MAFGIVGIVGAAALAAGIGALVMVLWNALLPALFGLPVVTFWQAAGLVVLAKILGGVVFGHRHRLHPPYPRHGRKHRPFPPFRCGEPAEPAETAS